MPVDSSDFLEIADALLAHDNPAEIILRTAGSRAYYGAYHKAREIVEKKQLPLIKIDNSGSHESLINTIHGIGTPAAKSAAEALKALKKFRHLCDYHPGDKLKPRRAAMKIEEAKLLAEKLNRL